MDGAVHKRIPDLEDSDIKLEVRADPVAGTVRLVFVFNDEYPTRTSARVVIDAEPREAFRIIDQITAALGELGVAIRPEEK